MNLIKQTFKVVSGLVLAASLSLPASAVTVTIDFDNFTPTNDLAVFNAELAGMGLLANPVFDAVQPGSFSLFDFGPENVVSANTDAGGTDLLLNFSSAVDHVLVKYENAAGQGASTLFIYDANQTTAGGTPTGGINGGQSSFLQLFDTGNILAAQMETNGTRVNISSVQYSVPAPAGLALIGCIAFGLGFKRRRAAA